MLRRNDRVSEQLFMPKTPHEMIVDHAGRLHERITDRRAHESKTTFDQVFAHRVGLRSARGHILWTPAARLQWNAARETPYVAIEAAEFLLCGKKRLRVANGRANLQPVANDAWVLEQSRDFRFVIAGYFAWIETVEC